MARRRPTIHHKAAILGLLALLTGAALLCFAVLGIAESASDWRNLARVTDGEGQAGDFVTTGVDGLKGTRFTGDFTPNGGGPTVRHVEYEGGAAPDGERVPAVRLDDVPAKVYTADGGTKTALVGEVLQIAGRLLVAAGGGLVLFVGALALRNAARTRRSSRVR